MPRSFKKQTCLPYHAAFTALSLKEAFSFVCNNKEICDPFWRNESGVAESRTEIWASEVGIGSKNRKLLFLIFSIFDMSRFFPKNVKPQPHPKCLKTSCEVGVPLDWARTKASRFGRFYQTGLEFQISEVSRPQSQSQCTFQQVLL